MSEPASPGGESAALQWAIENFRNNAHNLKDPDSAKKRLAYNKELLLHMHYIVETIQRGNSLSIVVPESSLELHRMDHDELVDLLSARPRRRRVYHQIESVTAAPTSPHGSTPGARPQPPAS